jgi:pyruvate/oxaloacetate carboxyltransferase
MGEELNTQSLSRMIQSWVHFDNLAATFTRQAQQARAVRSKWESQVLEYLQKTKMTNAIIQITGGRLTVNEEKTANPLTLQRLEQLLHEYFNKRPPGSTDETADILAYIKANRGAVIETRLKKH